MSFLLRFIKSVLRDVAEKAPEEIKHLPGITILLGERRFIAEI